MATGWERNRGVGRERERRHFYLFFMLWGRGGGQGSIVESLCHADMLIIKRYTLYMVKCYYQFY